MNSTSLWSSPAGIKSILTNRGKPISSPMLNRKKNRTSTLKVSSTMPRATTPVTPSNVGIMRSSAPTVSAVASTPMRRADLRQSAKQRQTMQKAAMSRYAGTKAAKNMAAVNAKVAAAKAARMARTK